MNEYFALLFLFILHIYANAIYIKCKFACIIVTFTPNFYFPSLMIITHNFKYQIIMIFTIIFF